MGNKATGPFREAYNPSLQGWQLHRRTEDYNVWQNPSTGEELEEYRFVINDVKEFQHEKEIFEFRYDSSTLVSSRYFREDTQRQLCSTYYKGTLFLQRIPIRLSNINDLPYPDVLHLYHQAFRGFAELYDKMGYFNIEENMICLNQQGRVKVWANGELEKSYPVERVMGGNGTEKEMVRRIIQLVDQNTDGLTLPENVGGLLLQADPETFRDADLMVQNFASRHRTTIPGQIDSVLRRQDIVRAVDSVYLHSAGQGLVGSNSSEDSPVKMSLVSGPVPQGMVGTAAFGQGTVTTHQTSTSVAPGMIQTFAPQQLAQTFAPARIQAPQTPITGIIGTPILANKTTTNTPQQQIYHPQPINIPTNRQPVQQTPSRSTSFIVRPNSGLHTLTNLQQHKHPSFVAASSHPNPVQVQVREPIHIQRPHNQNTQQQVHSVQQTFQQAQPSQKPTTAQKVVREQQQTQPPSITRGSYSHRLNSRSLASRPTEVASSNIQISQPQPQSASSTNRSYSSMISLGLKNNLVSAAKKLEQASEQQRTAARKVQLVEQQQEKRTLGTVKSQTITPMQHTVGTPATVRASFIENKQFNQVSVPSSQFMQHFNKLNQTRNPSVSHSGQFTNNTATNNLKQSDSGLFTVTERNNENIVSASRQANNSVFIQRPVGELKSQKPRILSTVDQTNLKGSHIFRSSQLHPSIQITYENSRIATSPAEVFHPADINVSFGRNEPISQTQIRGPPIYYQQQQQQQQVQQEYQQHQVVYGHEAFPAAEAILSSQQIMDTINQYRSKREDHIVNHLPVTYSVLKESEEYLQKYGFGRGGQQNYYGEPATSGIRVSLGSHYNEQQLGRNLYYNREQYQQQIQQLDEPFRPIYNNHTEVIQEYYTSSQDNGAVEVHEQKIVEHIETLNNAEMKYSVLEQTISSKRNDFRSFQEPTDEQFTAALGYEQSYRQQQAPIAQYTIVNEDYTTTMDSDLRKDLEKMRRSEL